MYLTLIFLTCCAIFVDLQILYIFIHFHIIHHILIFTYCVFFFFTKCSHVVLTAFEVTIVVPLGNTFLYINKYVRVQCYDLVSIVNKMSMKL